MSHKEGGGHKDFFWIFTDRDPALNAAIILVAAIVAIGAVFVIGFYAMWILAALGIAKAAHWYMTRPARTTDILKSVNTLTEQAQFPSPEEFFDAFFERYTADCKNAGIQPAGMSVGQAIMNAAVHLYSAENLTGRPSLRYVIEGSVADGQYRDDLIDRGKKAQDPARTVAVLTRALSRAFLGFTSELPPSASILVDKGQDNESTGTELVYLLSNTRQTVEFLMAPFYDDDVAELGLFKSLRRQLDKNAEQVSEKEFVLPTDGKLDRMECVDTYLEGTPFKQLFSVPVPFKIPEDMRFEHQWIVTPQGGGKTTFIQHQLIPDIERVARGEASVVVMDSQGDLLNLVGSLAAIPPEKLLVIEPDPEYPLALNLFDLGKSRMATYDARTRQMLDTNAIDLLTYVFDTLLGTQTTPKQTTLFRHAIRLCRAIPGATLKTFVDVINSTSTPYPEIVTTMPEATRDFFTGLFTNTAQFKETKQEIGWRLSLMLDNPTFAAMFSSEHSKLDLFTELNSSKVILINSDKSLLKEQGTELFGRFFIALLLQAAQERALIEKSNRLPVFAYIDECHDYIARDANITSIFDQARKMRMGLILAHQRIGQLDGKVLDALTNASIKCARAVNDSGAHTLARNMTTTPDFIQKQPVGSFAISLRNEPAVAIRVPHGEMEKMSRRSPAEMSEIRARMRERYAVKVAAPSPRDPPPSPEPTIHSEDPSQRPTKWPP
ncbi:hypothetical protein [Bradyrhizobium elkanii]|uniref:hypothetical protein n=1 Tax=Bradyrhizobium elkanii TaxID=29448 RepID=UPI003D1BA5F7